jgi:hypothetical protein
MDLPLQPSPKQKYKITSGGDITFTDTVRINGNPFLWMKWFFDGK